MQLVLFVILGMKENVSARYIWFTIQGTNYSPDSNIFRMNLTLALNHIIKIFSCTLNIFQPLSVLSSKDDLLLFLFT